MTPFGNGNHCHSTGTFPSLYGTVKTIQKCQKPSLSQGEFPRTGFFTSMTSVKDLGKFAESRLCLLHRLSQFSPLWTNMVRANNCFYIQTVCQDLLLANLLCGLPELWKRNATLHSSSLMEHGWSVVLWVFATISLICSVVSKLIIWASSFGFYRMSVFNYSVNSVMSLFTEKKQGNVQFSCIFLLFFPNIVMSVFKGKFAAYDQQHAVYTSSRVAYFSRWQQTIIVDKYEEAINIIKAKSNKFAAAKGRKDRLQKITVWN